MKDADLSDLELRMLAQKSGRLARAAGTFDAATGQPTDLARVRAAEIFKVPEDQVTPEQRRYAKTQLYSEMYNSTASQNFDQATRGQQERAQQDMYDRILESLRNRWRK